MRLLFRRIIGVYLLYALDIGQQGSRLSVLPYELLFPLYWF